MEEQEEETGTASGGAAVAQGINSGSESGGGNKAKLQNMKTAKLLKIMVKSLLRCSQDQRDTTSCLVDVFLGPADSPIFDGIAGQTKAYAQLDQQAKDKVGSPHLIAFIGALDALVKKGESIGQANLEKLTTYQAKVHAMEPAELNEDVRLFRQFKCYDQKKKRLAVCMVKGEERKALVAALIQSGFVRKMGRAPASQQSH